METNEKNWLEDLFIEEAKGALGKNSGGSLPDGVTIPTKLSDLENDLFGVTTRHTIFTAHGSEFQLFNVDDGDPIYVASLKYDIDIVKKFEDKLTPVLRMSVDGQELGVVSTIKSGDAPGSYTILTLDGSKTMGNLGFGYTLVNDDIIPSDTDALVVADSNYVGTFFPAATIECYYEVTSKIPADAVESNDFIATYGVTTHQEILDAHNAGKNCYVYEPETRMRTPIVRVSDEFAIGTLVGINDNGFVLGHHTMGVTLDNEWITFEGALEDATMRTDEITDDIESYPSNHAVYEALQKVLPQVTASDTGKVLRVSADGVWAAEAIPSAEGVSF